MNTEENHSSKFNAVYEKYKVMVFRTVMTYCDNNYHTAQEITQDVFVKCYIHEIYLKDSDYAAMWLRTVAKNSALDYLKKNKRVTITEEVYDKDIADKHENMEAWYIEKDEKEKRAQLTDSMIETLYQKNPRWHECLLSYYYLEESEAEIAKKMKTTTNAVKCMLQRIRNWAKKNYSIDEDT